MRTKPAGLVCQDSGVGVWPKMKLELQAEATSNLDIDVLKPVGDCGGLSSGQ